MRLCIVWLVFVFQFASSAWAQARFGKVLNLPGDVSYGEVPLSDVLRINGNRFTMESWIFFSGTSKLFYIGETRSGSNDYLIMQDGGGRWAGAVVRERFFLTNAEIELGAWQHIAVVYDSSAVRFYVNGEQVFEQPRSGEWIVGNNNIYFGSRPDAGQVLKGQMDEVRIWRVARSQQQIQATMEDTLGPAYYASADSGLIGYWRFDKMEDLGVGRSGANDARDYSIYNHHADLINNASVADRSVPLAAPSLALLPETPQLLQNYPNPFNPGTQIQFELPAKAHVVLTIYDLTGKEITTLIDDEIPAGPHRIRWRAAGVSTGVYFYKLKVNNRFVATRKMIYMR